MSFNIKFLRAITITWVDFRSDWALCAVASLSHRAKLPGGVRWAASLRCRVSGQHDVGHEGVITGRDALSLRSPIANPRGVAQPPLQSTYLHGVRFNKWYLYFCDEH